MVFFNASKMFIKWLSKYSNKRRIVDCGCGDGDLLRKLVNSQVPAFGIEPFWFGRDIEYRCMPVFPTYVQRCSLIKSHELLIVIARPDHGGWTDWVCHNAHPDSEVLYIGKPNNLDTDLCGWQTKILKTPVCPEEVVYSVNRIRRPEPSYSAKRQWELMELIA